MNKKPRMTNEEAIEVIKKNYPPENYTMLREALDIAMESLGKVDPIPLPTIKPGDKVRHMMFSGTVTVVTAGEIISTIEADGTRYDLLTDHLEVV